MLTPRMFPWGAFGGQSDSATGLPHRLAARRARSVGRRHHYPCPRRKSGKERKEASTGLHVADIKLVETIGR
jgi:hypothetical protein